MEMAVYDLRVDRIGDGISDYPFATVINEH
jgi:hypothetical protein